MCILSVDTAAIRLAAIRLLDSSSSVD